MAFNIQRFSDNIGRFGTLQTNRFEIRFNLPQGVINEIGGTPAVTPEVLSLRADRADMPGILLDTTDTRRYGLGPLIKTPTNKSRFNEATFSFIETKNGEIYDLFSSWFRTIIDYSGGGGTSPSFKINYKRDYSTQIEIRLFNNMGISTHNELPSADSKPTMVLQLVEAFPLSLSDTNLSWSNTNDIFRTNVVFAYTYHTFISGDLYNPS